MNAVAVLSGNRLMAKAEIRSPKSERNPKAEARNKPLQRCQFLAPKRVGLNQTAPAELGFLSRFSKADPSSVARGQRSPPALALLRKVDRLGFRASVFFRISDFGLRISFTPNSTRNSEEPTMFVQPRGRNDFHGS